MRDDEHPYPFQMRSWPPPPPVLSTTATLETEENGRCREVLDKSQYMDFFVGLDEKKWQL